MSLDLYVWISYEIQYFLSFQNDQHTVWLLRDSSCISFVALHEHLDIGKRTPLIRNFIDREGREKRERLTDYPLIDDWINSRKQQLHERERADPTKEMQYLFCRS